MADADGIYFRVIVYQEEDQWEADSLPGEDVSLFLSDVTAAVEYPLARQVLEALAIPIPADDELDQVLPAGDLSIFADLGLDEMELGAVSADLDLYRRTPSASSPSGSGSATRWNARWISRSARDRLYRLLRTRHAAGAGQGGCGPHRPAGPGWAGGVPAEEVPVGAVILDEGARSSPGRATAGRSTVIPPHTQRSWRSGRRPALSAAGGSPG